MIDPLLPAVALFGLAIAGLSLVAVRSSGGRPGLARRLAGPAEVSVGDLLDMEDPGRPVRVTGRIRCREPLVAPDGERLVAFHRDVEVRIGGRWRSLERLRETRSFQLWDHGGSISLDPAAAAEPLIAVPQVWRGSVAELSEPHASAAARLAERHGPATRARAVTRVLNVTDRLLVVARPVRDPETGSLRLQPPAGGYLISSVALDDAMRLLGGHHRRRAALGVVGIGIGLALLAAAGIGALLRALLA